MPPRAVATSSVTPMRRSARPSARNVVEAVVETAMTPSSETAMASWTGTPRPIDRSGTMIEPATHADDGAERPGSHGRDQRQELERHHAPDYRVPDRYDRAVNDSAPQGPLAGLRVLELSTVLAGPYCAMVLADLGADVIKVEPPEGDPTRGYGPPWLGPVKPGGERVATYFLSVNRNKRSLRLDLHREQGKEVARRLIAGRTC